MRLLRYFSVILLVFCLLVSCETVPITGRSQLSLVSDGQMNAMSLDYYKDFL